MRTVVAAWSCVDVRLCGAVEDNSHTCPLSQALHRWHEIALVLASAKVLAFSFTTSGHRPSIHPAVINVTPLLSPPGFAFDLHPPDPSTLEPLNPQGSTLLGRHILFKWEHDGWCMGVIKSQNKNSRTRVAGQVANFFVLYPMDNSTGTHALTPTTYNNLLDARAPTNNWVLLHRPP